MRTIVPLRVFVFSMFAFLFFWFIVGVNACVYGEQNVTCANGNKYTANDILGLSDWDVYTTCEKQDSLNELITAGICPVLGITTFIGSAIAFIAFLALLNTASTGKDHYWSNTNVAYKIGQLVF